jgi:hypothetical protein
MKEAPIAEAIIAVAGFLPPGLQVVTASLGIKVQSTIDDLRKRVAELEDEVYRLENPPHQLCGHSPENCKC